MTVPIQMHVVRFQCPHCRRSWAYGRSAIKHIERCWKNPVVRSCKTCKHFTPASYDSWADEGEPEVCALDVDLTGGCQACGDHGEIPFGPGTAICKVCDGNPPKAGPIVHCELWEAE